MKKYDTGCEQIFNVKLFNKIIRIIKVIKKRRMKLRLSFLFLVNLFKTRVLVIQSISRLIEGKSIDPMALDKMLLFHLNLTKASIKKGNVLLISVIISKQKFGVCICNSTL